MTKDDAKMRNDARMSSAEKQQNRKRSMIGVEQTRPKRNRSNRLNLLQNQTLNLLQSQTLNLTLLVLQYPLLPPNGSRRRTSPLSENQPCVRKRS
jgi:hypothetical protein